MQKVVISEPLRTAIGAFGGTLKDISPAKLGAAVVKEILDRTGIDPKEIDDCIMGNILSAGQGMNISRQIAIEAGLPVETPAFTINRVCGSGVQSIALAAQAIKAGDCRGDNRRRLGEHEPRPLLSSESPLRLQDGHA